MRVRLAGLITIPALLVASCSDDAPARTEAVSSFPSGGQGERVLEAYDQSGAFTTTITVPEGSREVAVRFDCVGSSGTIKVGLSASGVAEGPCSDDPDARGGMVVLSGDGSDLERTQEVTVVAPGEQKWSVAVDAGDSVTSD